MSHERAARDFVKAVIAWVIVAATVGCAGFGGSKSGHESTEAVLAADRVAEERAIEELIRGWFELLSRAEPNSVEIEQAVSRGPVTLVLFGKTITSRQELRDWVDAQSDAYSSIEYRVETIGIESDAKDLYRAHFEVTREAVDRNELLHVARSAQVFRIRKIAKSHPMIFETTEQLLLPLPGTGSRIMCL